MSTTPNKSPYELGREYERLMIANRPITTILVSLGCYTELRDRLVIAGTGGVIEERWNERKITMGDVCVVLEAQPAVDPGVRRSG